ncbi:MAG: M48 family metallopeptidase [Lachnospiraceae bacterium]|nr:M48 family metallopeptidase [Lachnospiraceae bacterium]
MTETQITVIRSRRKTIGIQIKPDGSVLVRAPYGVSEVTIRRGINEKRAWIDRQRKKLAEEKREAEEAGKLTYDEIKKLADEALRVIPPKAAAYAKKIGVTYGRITIRNQKTRWGSCSSKGNLNFNCLLMLAPEKVLDSVIVHELCHRKEMNHSKAFYDEVLRVFPEYHECHAWLREHGPALLRRMADD